MRISDWSSDVCSSDLDLADDLGVVHGQRGVRFGMLRRQCQRLVKRLAHLACDALLERLGDRQPLAVAAQCEGVAVVAVGFVGQRLDRSLGQFCRSEEHTSEIQSLIRHSYGVSYLKTNITATKLKICCVTT